MCIVPLTLGEMLILLPRPMCNVKHHNVSKCPTDLQMSLLYLVSQNSKRNHVVIG